METLPNIKNDGDARPGRARRPAAILFEDISSGLVPRWLALRLAVEDTGAAELLQPPLCSPASAS